VYLEPHSVVHRIDESVPADVAPLFIPVSNGVRWVQQLGHATAGDVVFVQGPGQHGLGCVVAAKDAGAANVIVAGTSRDAHRLEVARRLGADHTLVVDQDDVVDRVRAITGGRMADVVVDATAGAPRAAQTGVDVAAINGRVLVAGFREGRAAEGLNLDKVVMNGLTVIGAFSHEIRSVRAAIRLLESRRYDFAAMCTHTFDLDEVDSALQTLGGERDADAIHITVRPTTS
jgi:threonine dehydrogenase-like Zn-dependent dehydrogenase